jgi:hypothetical protein
MGSGVRIFTSIRSVHREVALFGNNNDISHDCALRSTIPLPNTATLCIIVYDAFLHSSYHTSMQRSDILCTRSPLHITPH